MYHAGDTNVFSDMQIINDLYEPSFAFIPIGDCLGMGPREAAYALKNFLPGIKTVVPMHYGTFPVLTGTPDDFQKELTEAGSDVKVINASEFLTQKAIVE